VSKKTEVIMDSGDTQKTLWELKARSEILQCVHRYARAVDWLDRQMLLSAYHPEALDDHGIFVGTAAQFADYFFEFHRKRQTATFHIITNHVCEMAGEHAHAESYYMYVCKNTSGSPMSVAGGRYIDRFEYKGGRWAIAARKCTVEWDLGAEAVLPPELLAAFAAVGRISRDATDASYERPLMIDPKRVGTRLGF
jgi:hypothetical protein